MNENEQFGVQLRKFQKAQLINALIEMFNLPDGCRVSKVIRELGYKFT